MKETITILAVVKQPYSFESQGGHKEGVCYKAVLAHFKAGEKLPYAVDIAKMPNSEEVVNRAVQNISKSFDGVCMFDRFGRFLGISG